MRQVGLTGAVLVASLVLAAVSAGAASAAPSWYECAKVAKNRETKAYEGAYLNSACTEASPGHEGEYELEPGVGKKKGSFAGSFSGTTRLHTYIPDHGDFPLECTKGKMSGLASLPNAERHVVLELRNCRFNGAPCQTGSALEVVITARLEGELGYISRSPLRIGLLLHPESDTYLTEYDCTGVARFRLSGSLIARQTGNVNTISDESELAFEVQPKEYGFGPSWVNNPTQFEGESGEHILLSEIGEEGYETFNPALPSGLEGSAQANGNALMVKA